MNQCCVNSVELLMIKCSHLLDDGSKRAIYEEIDKMKDKLEKETDEREEEFENKD